MTFAATLPLTGATYGALFAFADAARAAGVDPGSPLSYVTDAGFRDHDCVLGLSPEPTRERLPYLPVSHQVLGLLISVIDVVEDASGDARGVLADLTAIRDELVEELLARKTIHSG